MPAISATANANLFITGFNYPDKSHIVEELCAKSKAHSGACEQLDF